MSVLPADDPMVDALAALSDRQRSRLLAHLEGETGRSIARREGVSQASVAETLRSAPVRRVFFEVAGHRLGAANGEIERLISRLLITLQACAFDAKRPVVAGNAVFEYPDHRLRMEAALKLLDFVAPPEAAPRKGTTEVVAVERHVREVRQKTRLD